MGEGMEQRIHVLLVDASGLRVVVDWHSGRWLLPVVIYRERERILPRVVDLMARRRVPAYALGQWLGRVSPQGDAVDWVVVLRAADANSQVTRAPWTSIERLVHAPGFIAYQEWAIARLMSSGACRVNGPFGELTWLDRVVGWAEASVGAVSRPDILPYRLTSHTVVMRLQTASGRFYFKGLAPDAASEALLTGKLAGAAPRSFAATQALDKQPDGSVWWLMRECAGTALAARPTVASARRAAYECGRLQLALPVSIFDGLETIDIRATADWGASFLGRLADEGGAQRLALLVNNARDAVGRRGQGSSWLPLDLDPGNVLVDDHDIRFIDLDESYVGPGSLAAATFARRFRSLTGGAHAKADLEIRVAHARGLRSAALCERDWRSFEVLSIVLEMNAGWRRVRRNVERGELTASLDAIEQRIAHRLLRRLHDAVAR